LETIDMKASSAVFLALVALAGCESRPEPGNAPPPGISYRLSGTDIDATTALADNYCQGFGKRAALDKVSPAGNDKVATYDCR
jgi:hypothetical protein